MRKPEEVIDALATNCNGTLYDTKTDEYVYKAGGVEIGRIAASVPPAILLHLTHVLWQRWFEG